MRPRIWWRGRVDGLAGSATESVRLIVDRLIDFKVTVDGHYGWGQYLDREHHSGTHWGLYGTSSAVQTLGMKVRILQSGGRPSSDRLIASALNLLPEDVEHIAEALEAKKAKGDFDNVLKVAFIIDALRPDDRWVPQGLQPRIVQQLLARRVDEQGWSSRLPGDDTR